MWMRSSPPLKRLSPEQRQRKKIGEKILYTVVVIGDLTRGSIMSEKGRYDGSTKVAVANDNK